MRMEDRLRREITKCRRCEACGDLLESSCVVFPEMFKLVDREIKTGKKISTGELKQLVDRCTFCALCPCADIRTAILNAKTEYVQKHGLNTGVRLIENVARMGKVGCAFPSFTNFLTQNVLSRKLMETTVGINRHHKIPLFRDAGRGRWLSQYGTRRRSGSGGNRKVAYFSGCSAKYFFPDVPKAVVEVFDRNGIEVYYPEQKCCGMPPLLEGDRNLTLEFARFNVERLAEVVAAGYDIVCSCPTCGYMLKKILRVGADQAVWRRDLGKNESDFEYFEIGRGLISAISGMSAVKVPKEHFKVLLKDEGYFSSINSEKRIMISDNTYDVGEYLRKHHKAGKLNTRLGSIHIKGAYYPPCHLRERGIGKPYQYLMGLIPGLSVESIEGDHCCGSGGFMGFKRNFHHLSIKIASRLIAKIKRMNPQILATDCLSCKIQFNQLTPYRVVHPIELIKESYGNHKELIEKKAI